MASLKANHLNSQVFSSSLAKTEELQRSMGELGQQMPLLVTESRMIVDGERRYNAAVLLGWDTLKVIVVPDMSDDELMDIILDSSTVTRTLSFLEQVEVYNRTLVRLRRAHGVKKGAHAKKGAKKLSGSQVAMEAAKRAKFSSGPMAKKALLVAQSGTPEEIQLVDTGAVTVTKAYSLYLRRTRPPKEPVGSGQEVAPAEPEPATEAPKDAPMDAPMDTTPTPEVATPMDTTPKGNVSVEEALLVLEEYLVALAEGNPIDAVKPYLAVWLKRWGVAIKQAQED